MAAEQRGAPPVPPRVVESFGRRLGRWTAYAILTTCMGIAVTAPFWPKETPAPATTSAAVTAGPAAAAAAGAPRSP